MKVQILYYWYRCAAQIGVTTIRFFAKMRK